MSASLALPLLVKATLILSLSLILYRLTRRTRAAARHVLLAAGFAVLCALPVASRLLPSRVVELPASAPPPAPVLVVPVAAGDATLGANAAPPVASPSAHWPVVTIGTLLTGAWALGAIALIVPFLAGMWQARALRRTASPSSRPTAFARVLSSDAGIRRRVDVLVHPSIRGPMTFGVFRPTILLPADVESWNDEDLRQALIHELEHVRRNDWVTQCAARIVCVVYWFHPLVWMAWRRLRLEAERACDDAVLRRADPAAYADQLVLLAERLATATTQPLLAMAACRDLTTRVRAVLDAAQTRGRAGTRCVAVAVVTAALLVAAIAPLRAVGAGRGRLEEPQGPPLRFDTASVKPNKSGVEERYIRIDPGGGSLTVVNLQLRALITFAYQIQSFQLEGGPDWIASERFDILAKPERPVPGTGAFFDGQEPLRMMLRTLLADRFKLVMHKETKELPIYELVLARQDGKLGPQLRPAAMDCAARAAAARTGTPLPPPSGPPGPGSCGFTMNPVSFRAGGATMAMLAGNLEGPAQRLVIDRTGLTGTWDFEVKYTPDRSQLPPGVEPPVPIDWNGPSLFTALEEQLGLKLRPARGPVEVLVIDSVDRPSEN
jgi:uncharacterized protein (TIGR03435 family)